MIGKRGNRWWARIGSRKNQQWLGTFPTRREALEAERNALAKRRPRTKQTCDSFPERWLADYPRDAVASRRTYSYALKRFARDFSGVLLADVDRPAARAWALKHRYDARVVKTMFADALRDGLVVENPFANLRLETPRGRKDLEALTEAQIVELANLADPAMRAMILFAGFVGLRPGELFALEREHVDTSRFEVQVRQSADAAGNLKLPKNGLTRTVTLPPIARDAYLQAPASLEVPWAFVTPRGRQFGKAALNYYWRPIRTAFGQPTLAFYALRHACATLFLERGLSPSDVAQQLGHTDGGRLVQMLYGHPSEAAARERLKRAFRPAAPLRIATESQAKEKGA